MHAFNKPEAEAETQPEQEQDQHREVAFDNLKETLRDHLDDHDSLAETVRFQQSAIDVLSASVLELGRTQMRLKENIVELTTRCSELAGVLTSAAMKASAR